MRSSPTLPPPINLRRTKKASVSEGGAGGGTSPPQGGSVIPWAPVLQIENKHLASQGSFCFFENLMKTSFQRFPQKQKTPLMGVFVFCLIVELEGVEPSSTPEDHMFSTCLVLLDCREKHGAKHPSFTLAP